MHLTFTCHIDHASIAKVFLASMSGYCDSYDASANVSERNVQDVWCIYGCCKSGALYVCCENQVSPPVVEAASMTVIAICVMIILSVIFVRFKCVRLGKLPLISPGSSTESTNTAQPTQVTVVQHHNEQTDLPPSYTSCVAVTSRDAQMQTSWLTDLTESSSPSRCNGGAVISSFPTSCLPLLGEDIFVPTHGGTSVWSSASTISLPATALVPLGLPRHPSPRQNEWLPGQRRHSAIATGGRTRSEGSHFLCQVIADCSDPRQDPGHHQPRRLRANPMFVAATSLQDLRSRLLMGAPASSGFEPMQDELASHQPRRTRSDSVVLSEEAVQVHESLLPRRTPAKSVFVVADSTQDSAQLPRRTRGNSVTAAPDYTQGDEFYKLPRRIRANSLFAGVRGSHDILRENPALASRPCASCNFTHTVSHVVHQSVAGSNETDSVARSVILQPIARTPFASSGDGVPAGVILQPLALTIYDASICSSDLPTYEQVEEIMSCLDVTDVPAIQSDTCGQGMRQVPQENVADREREVALSPGSCELTTSRRKTDCSCSFAECDVSIAERDASSTERDMSRVAQGLSCAQSDVSTLPSVDVSLTAAAEDAIRTDAVSQPPHRETSKTDLETLPKLVLLLHGFADVRSQQASSLTAELTPLSDTSDIPPLPSVYSQGSNCPPPPPYTEWDSAPPRKPSSQKDETAHVTVRTKL